MALFDVVPPALFFLSIGGIVAIVARAVARMRQAAYSSSLKSAVQAPEMPAGKRRISGEAVSLLKPSQKSVQAIGNRFSVIRAAVTSSFTGAAARVGSGRQYLGGRVRAWRENRQLRRAEKHQEGKGNLNVSESLPTAEAVTPMATDDTAISDEVIIRPPEPRGWQRLRSSLGGALAARGEQLRSAQQAAATRLKRSPRGFVPREDEAVLTSRSDDAGQSQLTQAPKGEPDTMLAAFDTKAGTAAIRTTLVTAPVSKVAARAEQRIEQPEKKRLLVRKKKMSVLEEARLALAEADYGRAEDILVNHIVEHTKDTGAYLLLGKAAMGRQAWTEAIEIYEQVMAWNENQKGVWADMGHAAYCAGKYTKALPALQRAADEDPTNMQVLEDLMKIARNMDNPALQHAIQEKQARLTERERV